MIVTARPPVAVAGGGGAVGGMLVELLRGSGAEVRVLDPRDPDRPTDVTGTAPDLVESLTDAATVVLAVPEPVALAAARTLPPLLRPGALLVDTLSVKSRYAAALREHAPAVQAVGINPMFAPSLGMAGRVVAVVVHNDGADVRGFLGLLEGGGAKLVRLAADEHDRLCAATQVVTHAAVLAFGLALADLGVPAAQLAAVAPPPHTVMLSLLARIGLGRPEVYWDVQAGNPAAPAARAALVDGLARLTRVCEHGTQSEFEELLVTALTPLGEDAERYGDLCARIFGGPVR
ncbi:prephenate dehydrogenase/arogenate dehydrogenase family protein [Rhodococcus kronopolitis]|uniref:Prephenate dehydrogenase/arogenate dehydrogenase family protein n=1 Tax=Rhodococcus kronopolitis TaxID=1460226 RepID=A0ABV9FRL6_9NOCA